MTKVVKVISDAGVFFETGEVVTDIHKSEGGVEREVKTRLTKKFGYRDVVRGVDDATAMRLEVAHVVVIIGDDADYDTPAAVTNPDTPATGPAPSVDELTK